MKNSTRRYLVHGRVQGVGFRAFVHHQGQKLGVIGWVRNTDEGSVEVLATGTPKQLSDLAGFLHRGPRWAEVRSVEEFEAGPAAGRDFVIRY